MNTQTGIEKWRELDGDNTLALDWPLNEDSHVWEIGGFEGRWAQQIWDKFHCNITIFEPQDWAASKMRKRFEGIDKIEIRPYGLWTERIEARMHPFFTDGASILRGREDITAPFCVFKDFELVMMEFDHEIDLALMNIEGAEYALIPTLVASGAIKRFDYFWCQFHPENPDEIDLKTMEILKGMDRFHEIIWNCYPTAVAWKKR